MALYEPETRGAPADKGVNRGELIFRESRPFDPLKDAPTKDVTHRDGLGDARTEHY